MPNNTGRGYSNPVTRLGCADVIKVSITELYASIVAICTAIAGSIIAGIVTTLWIVSNNVTVEAKRHTNVITLELTRSFEAY